eukprot:555972-Pelagomonas_calceolata.AAC.2
MIQRGTAQQPGSMAWDGIIASMLDQLVFKALQLAECKEAHVRTQPKGKCGGRPAAGSLFLLAKWGGRLASALQASFCHQGIRPSLVRGADWRAVTGVPALEAAAAAVAGVPSAVAGGASTCVGSSQAGGFCHTAASMSAVLDA